MFLNTQAILPEFGGHVWLVSTELDGASGKHCHGPGSFVVATAHKTEGHFTGMVQCEHVIHSWMNLQWILSHPSNQKRDPPSAKGWGKPKLSTLHHRGYWSALKYLSGFPTND